MDAAPLTPAEARILDALLFGAVADRPASPDPAADRPDPPPAPDSPLASPNLLAALRTLNLSATDLLNWAASTAVAAALDALRQTLATLDTIRHRTLALDTLAAVAATSPDPIERRRAASSLLRATTPRGATGFATTPRSATGFATPPRGGTGLQPVPTAQPSSVPPPSPRGSARAEGRREEPPPSLSRSQPTHAPPPTPGLRPLGAEGPGQPSGTNPRGPVSAHRPYDARADDPCHRGAESSEHLGADQPVILEKPSARRADPLPPRFTPPDHLARRTPHSRATALLARAGAALHPP